MNTIRNIKNKWALLCLMLVVTMLAGCDTEGDEIEMGYYSYSFSFFYPEDISNDYEFVFNGNVGASGIVPKNEPDGFLEIREKGSGKNVFSQQISLAEQSQIQFIKIGEVISVYSPEKFISFIPTIIYSGDASQYSAWFGNQELQVGVLNYLSIDKQTGNFEIRKEGETDPVFSEEMTIEADAVINLLQISETDFIEVPEDTTPAPTESNKCLVRFYYPAGVFDAEEIRIDLYAFDENEWDWATELPCAGSVTVKKGEISDYVELTFSADGSQYISYMCDMTDVSTGEKLTDYLSDYVYLGQNENIPTDDGSTTVFSKVTYQIIDGYEFSVLEGLTTRR